MRNKMAAKKRLYVDMDGVLVDFSSALPHLSPEVKEEFAGSLDNIPGIFGLMEPMPGAIKAYHELANLFDTYILSTAPWENPSGWSDKVRWVRRHLGTVAHKRLIVTHHKHLNHGDFLIDDRTANGADRFSGEHILFGSVEFPNWNRVKAHLKKRIL
mgnify:CR=1 FL=1|jgi:5'(3')-deoxyribonucleotidase|tara:strand:+ start:3737 stop:4207 length:471 start_codon:yes stop_codon:yes gene_type:complete